MKSARCTRIFLSIVILSVLTIGAQATDLTMFCGSDVHCTGTTIPNRAKAVVQRMNSLPGSAYPAAIGGTVGTPSGVLICGDCCDGGTWGTTPATDTPQWYSNRNYQDQWNTFNYHFSKAGVTGDNNRLKYPTYVTGGNHDWWRFAGYTSGTSTYVAQKLKDRYTPNCNITEGNVSYAFNKDGVHFISLGRYPDQYVRSWLALDLANVTTSTPIVMFLHYYLNDDEEWWSYEVRDLLADIIDGYNVIAIFNGHTHSTQHYTWNGYDCYDDGSITEYGNFLVMHITDTTLSVGHYYANCDSSGNFTTGGWTWTHVKSL
ncbi:MAG: metallophosphoesterase [Armatimonadota bacterium]